MNMHYIIKFFFWEKHFSRISRNTLDSFPRVTCFWSNTVEVGCLTGKSYLESTLTWLFCDIYFQYISEAALCCWMKRLLIFCCGCWCWCKLDFNRHSTSACFTNFYWYFNVVWLAISDFHSSNASKFCCRLFCIIFNYLFAKLNSFLIIWNIVQNNVRHWYNQFLNIRKQFQFLTSLLIYPFCFMIRFF